MNPYNRRQSEKTQSKEKKNKHPISISRAHFCAISIAWALSKAKPIPSNATQMCELSKCIVSTPLLHMYPKTFASIFGAFEIKRTANTHTHTHTHHKLIMSYAVAHISHTCLTFAYYNFVIVLFEELLKISQQDNWISGIQSSFITLHSFVVVVVFWSTDC